MALDHLMFFEGLHPLSFPDMGFLSVYREYVLLPLVSKEASLACGRAEQS